MCLNELQAIPANGISCDWVLMSLSCQQEASHTSPSPASSRHLSAADSWPSFDLVGLFPCTAATVSPAAASGSRVCTPHEPSALWACLLFIGWRPVHCYCSMISVGGSFWHSLVLLTTHQAICMCNIASGAAQCRVRHHGQAFQQGVLLHSAGTPAAACLVSTLALPNRLVCNA